MENDSSAIFNILFKLAKAVAEMLEQDLLICCT